MRCDEIMKRQVEQVAPNDTVQTAARRMRDHNVGFLPVCEESGKVVGTLTDRDIVVRSVADGQENARVADVMTHAVVACGPRDDVREAERLMGQHHKSRIMVVDDSGILVGIISLSDVAQHESGARAARTMREITDREARP
jgi:CBS domain-containing protein